MTTYELLDLVENGLLFSATAVALIIQGRSLRKTSDSIELISQQISQQDIANENQVRSIRIGLLTDEAKRLTATEGLASQRRLQQIDEELNKIMNHMGG